MLSILCRHLHSSRDSAQCSERCFGYCPGAQQPLIAEQRQVALIRKERMCSRMRRDNGGRMQICRAQRCMIWRIEREIDKPVVDKIDRATVQQQSTAFVAQATGIRDLRLKAVPLQEALCNEKLWIEVLVLGPVIDNGDSPRSAAASLQPPFLLEHVKDGGNESCFA